MMLSIIIPSYCSEDNLNATLQALAAQCQPQAQLSAEIIVVDCSPNQKVDKICATYPAVRLIKQKQRFNPGGGRNIGAKAANGETLVFIDSDVVLEANALENIQQHSQAGKRVFGGALELSKNQKTNLSSYIEHYYFNHESQSTRSPTVRSNLSSALLVINRQVFLDAGGFSDIPRMQDTELTERLASHGEHLFFFPDVIGYQIQDSPLKKVFKKIFITGNNLYFLRFGQGRSWLFKALLFVLLPLMMLAKITRINLRNIRYKASPFMLFVLCPSMYLCGLSWMFGYYKALLFDGGIASKR